MSGLVLAIEGGGTKTRILLADMEGNILAEEHLSGASPLYINRDSFAMQLRDQLHRVRQVMESHGGRVFRLGLAAPMDRGLVQDVVREIFGHVHCIEASEGEVTLMLHGLQVGVALVAGTGASCRAINESGEHITCGGFGPQFGDEGSGYWIGREAIRAVALAEEGRGPETLLQDQVYQKFRVGNYWHLLNYANGNGHLPVPEVAALTHEVFRSGKRGDSVAIDICLRAGRELGKLVTHTTAQARIERVPTPLAMSGGVFWGEALITRGIEQVLKKSPTVFQLLPPEPEPGPGLIRLLTTE